MLVHSSTLSAPSRTRRPSDTVLHLSRSRPSSFPRPSFCRYSVGISLKTLFNRCNSESRGPKTVLSSVRSVVLHRSSLLTADRVCSPEIIDPLDVKFWSPRPPELHPKKTQRCGLQHVVYSAGDQTLPNVSGIHAQVRLSGGSYSHHADDLVDRNRRT
jgi:hypothetical protein